MAEQPAVRVLELVDATACVDQHQLVARVYKDSVDLQSFTGLDGSKVDVSRPLASSARSPHAFGRERERAVADDGDLDAAELEAVETRLRSLARLGRTGQGGGGGG